MTLRCNGFTHRLLLHSAVRLIIPMRAEGNRFNKIDSLRALLTVVMRPRTRATGTPQTVRPVQIKQPPDSILICEKILAERLLT